MMSVLVTRPKHQAGSFVEELKKYNLTSVVFPTIEIRPTIGWTIPDISVYNGAFFTSPNSVHYFLERLEDEAPEELEELKKIKIFAVGKTTAKDLANYGIITEPVPKVADAVNLMQGIDAKEIHGKSFLFLRGSLSLGIIPAAIAERGGTCDSLTVYENHPPDLKATETVKKMVNDGDIACLSFTSPSTAQNYFKAIGSTDIPSGVLVAAIGKTTANALEELGITVDIVPEYYDGPHFAKAIAKALSNE
ncbi:uroporphyrinogen-III synthase [Prosthecochloris sp. SCSIO W1103]|uniref:uroporphyrinogen-III synthase n=1 Tax=Prosthecochloris sp. SCSIO W1103 TaxID=2992244 RepID=UPI00223D8382|nr:uroporphyrinogen-III synthase [Prosthecochloris sp. SCSIO W1103]UZJ36755.1 uroporphyrinogen-III synthase [Prosthecochloris sp. SCSIO W1103]